MTTKCNVESRTASWTRKMKSEGKSAQYALGSPSIQGWVQGTAPLTLVLPGFQKASTSSLLPVGLSCLWTFPSPPTAPTPYSLLATSPTPPPGPSLEI